MAKASGGTRNTRSSASGGGYLTVEDRIGTVKDSDILGHYSWGPNRTTRFVKSFEEEYGEPDEYKESLRKLPSYQYANRRYETAQDNIIKLVDDIKGATEFSGEVGHKTEVSGKIEKLLNHDGYGVRDLIVRLGGGGYQVTSDRMAFKTLKAAKSYIKGGLINQVHKLYQEIGERFNV